MKSWFRYLVAVLALLCGSVACAAPYPTEGQLRSAIGSVAGLLKTDGLALEILDARKEGMTQPLLAAVLSLSGDSCMVFYNTRPEDGLIQFFEAFQERDLPVLLNALAVHEAMHCFEQREALIRKRFDKVLPADFKPDIGTVQGYLSILKTGVLVTWGEALADIASLLYLKQTVPDRWEYFANGIAAMRRDLAGKWPEHDTSAWLFRIIAAGAVQPPNQNLFEAALRLRGQYRPGQ